LGKRFVIFYVLFIENNPPFDYAIVPESEILESGKRWIVGDVLSVTESDRYLVFLCTF
jgi:hypothetical protein